MPTVTLTSKDTGAHHAEVIAPVAQESLGDLTAGRLRLSLIRMLARAEKSSVQFSGDCPKIERTQFERARTAFIRFIRSTRSPSAYSKEFRGYQQISIDFRAEGREQVIASHTPKPLPDVVKMFEIARANRIKIHPPTRIPIYLQDAWAEVQQREAERWQRAVELHARGYSLKDIRSVLVQEFADGRGDIASWARGEHVPWLLRSFFNLPSRSQTFNKNAFEEPQSGYLLGAIVASVRRLHTAAIIWHSQDPEGINRLATVIKTVLGVSRQVRSSVLPSGLQQYEVSIRSGEFAEAVIAATSASQHVPWHLLKTPAHEREFARALLDFATGISHKDSGRRRYPLVELTFTGREELVTEIRILLGRHGIYGSLSYDADTRVSRVELSGERTLAAVEAIGFSADRKREKLAYLRKGIKTVLRDYSVEEYDLVMTRINAGLPVRQIARETGISRDVVGSWKEGAQPVQVKRAESVRALLEKTTSPEVFSYLVGERKVLPAVAREIGRGLSIDEAMLLRISSRMREPHKPQLRRRSSSPTKDEASAAPMASDISSPMTTDDEIESTSLSGIGGPKNDLAWFDKAISQYPVLSLSEERELMDKVQTDAKFRQLLVLHNLRLIPHLLKRNAPQYRRRDPELINYCLLVLSRAANDFNPSYVSDKTGQTIRFASFAGTAIEREIWRVLSDSGSEPMSPAMRKHVRALDKAERSLRDKGEEVSEVALMEATGLSLVSVRNAIAARKLDQMSSLDAPIGSSETSTTRGELLGKSIESNVSLDFSRSEITAAARKAFVVLGLPDRTQDILLQRFGFSSSDPDEQVFAAIGRQVGVGTERVRQIVEDALEKIRQNLHLKVVRELLVALE